MKTKIFVIKKNTKIIDKKIFCSSLIWKFTEFTLVYGYRRIVLFQSSKLERPAYHENQHLKFMIYLWLKHWQLALVGKKHNYIDYQVVPAYLLYVCSHEHTSWCQEQKNFYNVREKNSIAHDFSVCSTYHLLEIFVF